MKNVLIIAVFLLKVFHATCQQHDFSVIAYYAGKDTQEVEKFAISKLTHVIFSFCHLKGNRLNVDQERDSVMIHKLAGLKTKNPNLKVMLSLGGWGGCETCSDVFSEKHNRKAFAVSVKKLGNFFGTDGIDLDWEYPAIEGYPQHHYQPGDRENFTKLVKQLRKTLGKSAVISFAAGGFSKYIQKSVDWSRVMKEVNFVNLMTYDLVNGYATTTGHHTPLYSNAKQVESVDHAVRQLLALKVPQRKIVIGAAMYGRVWKDVPDVEHGLYQKGIFLEGVAYKNLSIKFSSDSGFVEHWDETSKAPFLYHPERKLFVTYDNPRSMELKTKYARERGLGGMMFWQLTEDIYQNGLLDAIDKASK